MFDSQSENTKSTTAIAACLTKISEENLIEVPAFLLKQGIALGQYVTVQRVSEIYGMPKWKFYECVRRGLLRAYRLLNGRIYLRLSDVERLIQQSV